MDKLKKYHIAGYAFTLATGTLLHFAYRWSGENPAVAVFSAVNESVWEHLKLLFWPVVVFGAVEYFAYGRNYKSFVPVKALSLCLGLVAVIAAHYSYTGVTGKDIVFLDVLIFVLAAGLSYFYCRRALKSGRFSSGLAKALGWAGLLVLIAAFTVFTFCPPGLPIFRE